VAVLELEVLSCAKTIPTPNTNTPIRIPIRFITLTPPWRKPADGTLVNPSYGSWIRNWQ
jgi:hypothetical protein